jgi:hypothetical protein
VKTRKTWTVLLAAMALFATSAIAMAEEGEDEGDTVFNFGYDPENQVFVWGTSSTDGTLDCRLESGEYDATYLVLDGDVFVDELYAAGSEDLVAFSVNDDEEAEPVPYSSDGECALSGGVVAGPEGQVNHGMFLKLFNSVYQGHARGCIVRHIAQSDLGMGDQQVKVEDVDPDAPSLESGATGTLDLTSIITKCENGKGKPGSEEGNGGASGKPDWAGNGKPDWAGQPGGPGNGPGGDGNDD